MRGSQGYGKADPPIRDLLVDLLDRCPNSKPSTLNPKSGAPLRDLLVNLLVRC